MAPTDDGPTPPSRNASSAAGPVSTCRTPFDPAGDAERYVRALLDLYLSLPGTPEHVRPVDRRCARSIYDRRVPLATARSALLLGAARRTLRSPERPPLRPVGALHYFLPVIEEVLGQPPEPEYVDYLAHRLRPWMKPIRSP